MSTPYQAELAAWRERAGRAHEARTAPQLEERCNPHPHAPVPSRVEYDGEPMPAYEDESQEARAMPSP